MQPPRGLSLGPRRRLCCRRGLFHQFMIVLLSSVLWWWMKVTGAEAASVCLANLVSWASWASLIRPNMPPSSQILHLLLRAPPFKVALASVWEGSEHEPREEDEEGVGAECQKGVLVHGEGQRQGVVKIRGCLYCKLIWK